MDYKEMMSIFIDHYIVKNRTDRWHGLIDKYSSIYKNLNQLERHLNEKCTYIDSDDAEQAVIAFVTRFQPCWIWSIRPEDPIKVVTDTDVKQVFYDDGFPWGLLVISASTSKALYWNNDTDGWICGD